MSRLASILVLLMMLPMILAVTAAPASAQSGEPTCENTEDEIQRRLRQRLEEEEQVRPQEQTQTTWPTRRTGVLEFLNFSDHEYTLSIGGTLQSLHAGHRLYPNKTWIELPAGTYEYDLLSDNGVIHGQARVFETLTWPVPIGDYYQEPTPPPPIGPYAPADPTVGTLVIRNSSTYELSVWINGRAYNLHRAEGGHTPELILQLPPGTYDYLLLGTPRPPLSESLPRCQSEVDPYLTKGIMRTVVVRSNQVSLADIPQP